MTSSYRGLRRATYFRCTFTDTQHFYIHRVLLWHFSTFLFLFGTFTFGLLVLKSRHWKQILEQKVKQNERIKLKVAIVLLFKTCFCH